MGAHHLFSYLLEPLVYLTMSQARRTCRKAAPGCGPEAEALKRGRRGQHSIRLNDQYRICFEWTVAGPEHVEVVDYHD